MSRRSGPLLRVEGLSKSFGSPSPRRGPVVNAVSDVDLTVESSEVVGLVGESGCGKSTLARCVVGLLEPTTGSILLDGVEIHGSRASAKTVRRGLQMVFQNPAGSLDPRMTIRQSVAEPLLKVGKRERDKRVTEALGWVGLSPDLHDRYPARLSGGQQQRACIARALAAGARLVVLDEAISSLDVSLQAQMLGLLQDLRTNLGLSFLFISHDLAAVQSISDRILVMYLGRIVESAPLSNFHRHALHPYSHLLRSSALLPDPVAERRRKGTTAVIDRVAEVESQSWDGCDFAARCPRASDRCHVEAPQLLEMAPAHLAACHHPGESPEGSGNL